MGGDNTHKRCAWRRKVVLSRIMFSEDTRDGRRELNARAMQSVIDREAQDVEQCINAVVW